MKSLGLMPAAGTRWGEFDFSLKCLVILKTEGRRDQFYCESQLWTWPDPHGQWGVEGGKG